MTKKEYDAIINHPNVIFLYPNALYAEVSTNYETNTITLVHGHDYPDSSVKNGFGWKYDNSRFEYDVDCPNWYFYTQENYTLLNCYPEYELLSDEQLVRSLKNPHPSNLITDIANWSRYPDDTNSISNLLSEFGIWGSHIPDWVHRTATLVLNDEISPTDFANLMIYLHDQNILK